MRTYCNPLDLGYKYQHFIIGGRRFANREAADPTLVLFKGRYYLFPSMSGGFWYSDDLLMWRFHENRELLIYDYAPDVRQIGEYLYFCASRSEANCPILRTMDPLADVFEEVSAPFPFWDPDIFCDDDGRVYLFFGCSNTDPIFGVEMDAEKMVPLIDPIPLIAGREMDLGFERPGENGRSPASARPYIEGAFMTKHGGKYYLQYACPGTQFNTYSDGVYVSDRPLGPFTLQSSNPFSGKPGGFIRAAGHGSTIEDKYGNFWHVSTMRISVNHMFERRVGLWPAGFDRDGELFCNQNFGDYPVRIPEGKFEPLQVGPEWMLLSYKKPVLASSTADGSDPSLAVDEDICTWWSAGVASPGESLTVDLQSAMDIRAIQINLADEGIVCEYDENLYVRWNEELRYIEERTQLTHITVEISDDGEAWSVLDEIAREGANLYLEHENGVEARYVRVTGGELPYGQSLRISGLRVFGNGGGEKPAKANASAIREGDLDGLVKWEHLPDAQGVNVRYGVAPDKLYQSWMVYDADELRLTTLMKGRDYYIRVDSFNENGITEGELIYMDAAASSIFSRKKAFADMMV